MSSRSGKPSVNVKIRTSLLDRMAKICAQQGITRNELLDLMLEHGCRAFENADQAVPQVPNGTGAPMERVDIAQKLVTQKAEPEPPVTPAPHVVSDAEGNTYQLTPLSSAEKAQLSQRRIKVTGQDAATQLDEAIQVATGQTMEDFVRREQAHEASVGMAKITAEAMAPGPDRDRLEMEGSLHIHTYVPVPGTTQKLDAEPYTGQLYATFKCADRTCGTTVVRPLE